MYYLISRAAELAGVSTSTIRVYCRLGFLCPARDSAGRRLFTDEDVEHIRAIKDNGGHP